MVMDTVISHRFPGSRPEVIAMMIQMQMVLMSFHTKMRLVRVVTKSTQIVMVRSTPLVRHMSWSIPFSVYMKMMTVMDLVRSMKQQHRRVLLMKDLFPKREIVMTRIVVSFQVLRRFVMV